ncbi:MAG: thioredoxin [Acidimicrobiia bacterium]|nr:thioredoxin [Acidimicrobiia bacterium]
MEGTGPFVKDVTMADFQQEVLVRSREVPVLVDFWAEWCGPCRTLSPLLERMTSEANGAFELAKVDVDANPELSAQFLVQSIPTVVAIKDGKEVNRFSGALPEQAINEFLTTVLPTELDLTVDEARTALIEGDHERAERLLRSVLEAKPDHQEAGTSLAALLIDRADVDEALIVLGKLVPDTEVDRLQAAARLRQSSGDDIAELEAAATADPDDDDAQLALAKALAAHAEFEPALDRLLVVVKRKGPGKEQARKAMVDIFGVLGNDHPLTVTYRRQLGAALY